MGMTYYGILHQDGLHKEEGVTKQEVFKLFLEASKLGQRNGFSLNFKDFLWEIYKNLFWKISA